jgi:pyruvate/2-oxoglutarate/acetoin dehydrogenase E1 component
MPIKSYAQALVDALAYSLAGDASVTIIGRGLTGHGPEADAERALYEQYADRILDPPTSEGVMASVGAGAAMAGLRPFVHFGTAAFAFEAVNQLVNEAGNAHYMSGGQITAPVIYHLFHGIRGGGGPQHSHSPQAMYANAAGLQILLPGSPADMQGLLRSAFKSNNPTLLFSHTKLLGLTGEVPDGDFSIPLGQAEVKRRGRDVTIVATSLMVQEALKAADILAEDMIEAEIVDPRTAVPLDRKSICESVGRTGRLVVVDEANMTCSIASEIAASVAEQAFASLKAPILRVARPDAPVAFSPPLERAVTPAAEKIVAAVRKLMR